MNETANFFFNLNALFGIGAFLVYVISVFRGGVKPHLFSWCLWFLLNVASVYKLLIVGSNEAALSRALLGAFLCLLIAALALVKGQKEFEPVEGAATAVGFGALALWFFFPGAVWEIQAFALSIVASYIPTFVKAFRNPREENAITFLLYFLGGLPGVWVLAAPTFSALMFSWLPLVAQGTLVGMIWVRRRAISFS